MHSLPGGLFMDYEYEDCLGPELFSEIDIFLKDKSFEDIDISLHNEDFNYVSLKLPADQNFDVEGFLDNLEKKNQNKFYIITTLLAYLDEPELKKYYIPYACLNDFLYLINDPEYNEQVISIIQAEED